LLLTARRADPTQPKVFSRFYLGVWVLFFVEYALVPLAVILR